MSYRSVLEVLLACTRVHGVHEGAEAKARVPNSGVALARVVKEAQDRRDYHGSRDYHGYKTILRLVLWHNRKRMRHRCPKVW